MNLQRSFKELSFFLFLIVSLTVENVNDDIKPISIEEDTSGLPCCGISFVQISPPLSQTTWVVNYIGPMYTVAFDSLSTPLHFQWTVSQSGLSPTTLNITSAQCLNHTMTSSNGFSATCTAGTETVLHSDQPIVNESNITLKATGPSSSVTFETQLNLAACNVTRELSTAISASTPCGYNCTATFQCIHGYSTPGGVYYFAQCSNEAKLEPSEQCTPTVVDDNELFLPIWAIVLITVGGLLLLGALVGLVIWKCRSTDF